MFTTIITAIVAILIFAAACFLPAVYIMAVLVVGSAKEISDDDVTTTFWATVLILGEFWGIEYWLGSQNFAAGWTTAFYWVTGMIIFVPIVLRFLIWFLSWWPRPNRPTASKQTANLAEWRNGSSNIIPVNPPTQEGLSPVGLKPEKQIKKKKRKSMPRIFRFILWSILVGFVWKFYINIEAIISFGVERFL